MTDRKIIEDNIRTAINQNNNLKSNKNILEEIFSNLIDYNNDKYNELYSEINAEKNINYKYWRITTSMTKNDTNLKGTGWSYIYTGSESSKIIGKKSVNLPDDSTFSKIVKVNDSYIIASGYLMCSLSDLDMLSGWDNKYKGIIDDKEFEYYMILSDTMINAEKKIFETADLYNIKSPVIFAPMSRRFVYIISKDIIFEDIKGISEHKISLEFENNNLTGVFNSEIRSIWNIEFSDVSSSENSIRLDGYVQKQFYKYHTSENQYIMPDCLDYLTNKKNIRFNEKETSIVTDEEIISQQKRMTINSNENCNFEVVESGFVFDTDIVLCNKERVRSKADIAEILFPFFKTHNIKLDNICNSSNGINICKYKRGFEYSVINNDFLGFRGRDIYLKFSVEKEDLFMEDKIIFIINYLQINYPEFNWKGGY